METVIRNFEELRALRTRRARRGMARVVVELPGDIQQSRRLERVLNSNLHTCGCEMAAIFAAAGFVGLALHADFVAANTLRAAGLLAAITVTGKAIGFVIAEWRVRSVIDRYFAREESFW